MFSIVLVIIMMIYSVAKSQKLMSGDETIFMSSAKYYDTDKEDMNLTYFEDYKVGSNSSDNHIATYSMGEFEDSFNIFVGTANSSMDLLDNPYVEFNIYGIDQNWGAFQMQDIKLRKCSREDLT